MPGNGGKIKNHEFDFQEGDTKSKQGFGGGVKTVAT